jgi:hypothetical protein
VIRLTPAAEVLDEVRGMARQLTDRRLVALYPLFLYSNWFYAYQFDAFNAPLFDARTQGLNNALYWAAQMLGAWLLGRFLDDTTRSTRRRAATSFALTCAVVGGTWAAGLVCNHAYGLDGEPDKLDFVHDSTQWAPPFVLYVVWGGCDALVQCWVYWILGQLDDDAQVLARFSGIYKAVQSVGAAASWALAASSVSASTQAWINIALFALALPPAAHLIAHSPSFGAARTSSSTLPAFDSTVRVDQHV